MTLTQRLDLFASKQCEGTAQELCSQEHQVYLLEELTSLQFLSKTAVYLIVFSTKLIFPFLQTQLPQETSRQEWNSASIRRFKLMCELYHITDILVVVESHHRYLSALHKFFQQNPTVCEMSERRCFFFLWKLVVDPADNEDKERAQRRVQGQLFFFVLF